MALALAQALTPLALTLALTLALAAHSSHAHTGDDAHKSNSRSDADAADASLEEQLFRLPVWHAEQVVVVVVVSRLFDKFDALPVNSECACVLSSGGPGPVLHTYMHTYTHT